MTKKKSNKKDKISNDTNGFNNGRAVASDKSNVIAFMKFRFIAMFLSLFLMIVSVVGLAIKGLNLGLDFTGGTLIELKYENDVDIQPFRNVLEKQKVDNAVAQHFGSSKDIMIRVPPSSIQGDVNHFVAQLKSEMDTFVDQSSILMRVDVVGPQIGDELKEKSGIAMLIALGCMLLYVAFRFKMQIGVGAVLALFHDILIVLGFFAWTGITFDLNVLAAILAVIGYSLNDSIVVSDRIREVFTKNIEWKTEDVLNLSLTQTLGRTLLTSFTTMLVLVALIVFGGADLAGFAIALTVGVLIGTYSSMYVVTNALIGLGLTGQNFVIIQQEEMPEDYIEPDLRP